MANHSATPHNDRMQKDGISRVFAALADPTRRQVLSRLESEGPLTVGALADPLPIKLPAVMKHLGVLSDAGLIVRRKQGRVVTVTLEPEPLREARDWLARYERFWTARLDRLAEFLEEDDE